MPVGKLNKIEVKDLKSDVIFGLMNPIMPEVCFLPLSFVKKLLSFKFADRGLASMEVY